MKNVIVEFKVALGKAEALRKEHKLVTLRIDFPEHVMNEVFKAATKSYVIDMQSQIRNHWDDFMKCDLPEIVEFGSVLYGKKQRVVARPLTQEELNEVMRKRLGEMSPAEIMKFADTGEMPERFLNK